ncbi:MAG: lipocalin family protein [Bacteroidota bacterium]|nr:lipocalin family protein [Bacteroidota bacterium]
MIRRISFLFSLVLGLALLSTGCKKDDNPTSPIVGIWKVYAYDGVLVTDPCEMQSTVQFNADNTGMAIEKDLEENNDCTTTVISFKYSYSNNKLVVTSLNTGDVTNVDVMINNNTLTLSNGEGGVIIYKR